MIAFPSASPAAAGTLSPNAPHGIGIASELGRTAASRTCAPSPQVEQERWFTCEVVPYEPALRAWLWRHHPSLKEEVDDIVQESYLRLMRARAAGPLRCPRTYLFGIARHVALGIHCEKRHISFTPVNELPEADTIEAKGDVIAMVTHHQELALTAEAIKQLPDRCREIVSLHTVEELSYREIADRLGLAEVTVRVQMARAVKKCIAFLRQRGEVQPEGRP